MAAGGDTHGDTAPGGGSILDNDRDLQTIFGTAASGTPPAAGGGGGVTGAGPKGVGAERLRCIVFLLFLASMFPARGEAIDSGEW